jgi:recombination protein RecA
MSLNLSQKLALVGKAMQSLDKQFGKGTLIHLESHTPEPVEYISTGSLALNRALGCGGLPRGRIVEIYGPESSGKTTLALHVVAECQKLGGVAAFVDAEHALDLDYAKALGVNEAQLFISQPDHGEQALEVVDTLVKSGGMDVIVIDSVAALTPKAELAGEVGDAHVGLQARMMNQALRMITANAARSKVTVVFLNQIRQKIGVTFGSPETTTGGNALKFFASVRIDVRRIGALKDGERNTGNRTKFKVVKNKCAPPFGVGESDILFGTGFDTPGELVDLAVEFGLIEKSGAWYSMGKERLGQGRDTVRALIEAKPSLREDLLKKIEAAEAEARAARKPLPRVAASASNEADDSTEEAPHYAEAA